MCIFLLDEVLVGLGKTRGIRAIPVAVISIHIFPTSSTQWEASPMQTRKCIKGSLVALLSMLVFLCIAISIISLQNY